ncbi:hypothetical protein GCM10027262_34030 [Nocardia tengchongensis]
MAPVSFSATGMLLTAVRLSKRFRNHMRCCASDSGTSSGRSWATRAARAPVPTRDSSCAASEATVEASKRARSGMSASSAADRRAITWVAISELPPSSKKSSSRPTRSRPSTSAMTPATVCCTGVAGARKTWAAKVGAGSCLRSSLPEALSGKASSTMKAAGTM